MMLIFTSPYADRGVLGEDRDALLALEVGRVHDPVDDLLAGAERAGLAEHGVDEGGLAVVDVGDDGDVAQRRGEETWGTPERWRRGRRGDVRGTVDSTGRSAGGGFRPAGRRPRRPGRPSAVSQAKKIATRSPGSTTISSEPDDLVLGPEIGAVVPDHHEHQVGHGATKAAKMPGHARRDSHDATTAPSTRPAPPPNAHSTGGGDDPAPGPVDARFECRGEGGEEQAGDDRDRRPQPHRPLVAHVGKNRGR